jgi:DNA replication licensing factor MCM2
MFVLLNRDYRPIPALDRYDGDVLDEDDYDNMSPGARAAAERELQRRDLEEGTGRRDADGILYGL